MKKNELLERGRAGILALVMAFSLAVPQVAVANVSVAKSEGASATLAEDTAATGVATSGTSADVAELRNLLKANLLKDYDPAVSGEMDIVHEERSRDAADILTLEAQVLKSRAKGKTVKYQIYDINNDESAEMFVMYPSGKKGKLEIYRYNDSDFSTAKINTTKNVTAVYKNAKKKQIAVVSAPGSKKTTIATYKLSSSGKLKSVSTYTKNKNTYKKGKKKIAKKAFDKFHKSVKKLSKIKVKSIPKENYEYKVVDECFYSKDLIYEMLEDETGKDNFFMTKGGKDTPSQDKCLAYSFSYDSVGYHEYSAEPGIVRYVFGPDVVNPKTGKTYQEEDWDALYKQEFVATYAPPFITESLDENGKAVLDVEADAELHSIDVKECTAKNGDLSYKAKEYAFEYGDCQMRITFFTEGPQKDRVAAAGIYYPHITGEIPHDKWQFIYAEQAGNPAEHDAKIYDWVTAGGVDKEAKVRTLSVESDDASLAQTIKTAENVMLLPYTRSGKFYTFREDGTTKYEYPYMVDDEDIKGAKDAYEFLEMFNPASGQLSFGDPAFPKGLYWKAN